MKREQLAEIRDLKGELDVLIGNSRNPLIKMKAEKLRRSFGYGLRRMDLYDVNAVDKFIATYHTELNSFYKPEGDRVA